MTLAQMVVNYAIENCIGSDATSLPASESRIQADIVRQFSGLQEELEGVLSEKCTEQDGFWFVSSTPNSVTSSMKPLNSFYTNVFGGRATDKEKSLGTCYENSTMVQWISYNADNAKDGEMARYDAVRDECVFTDKWYEQQCSLLGNGYFENGVCYVAQ